MIFFRQKELFESWIDKQDETNFVCLGDTGKV